MCGAHQGGIRKKLRIIENAQRSKFTFTGREGKIETKGKICVAKRRRRRRHQNSLPTCFAVTHES